MAIKFDKIIGSSFILANFLLMSAAVWAQPATTIESISIDPNGNDDVSIDFANNGTVTQITLEIQFDNTQFTADIANCGGGNATVSPGSVTCSIPVSSPNLVRIALLNLSTTAISDGTFGSINFEANGTPPGNYPITFVSESYSDENAQAVAPSGSVEGNIEVIITGAPGYGSAPAPGETIDLGSAVVGETVDTATNDIVVSEIGDQQLQVTALPITGPDAGDFASATGPFNIDDGGAAVDVDLSCTPSSRGDLTATIELTNNSSNNGTPQYTLNCVGLTPNVFASTPPTITGLTVDPTPPTGTINVTNPQDGFTSTAFQVTATEGTGDAAITVTTGGPQDIAPDGSFDFVVECDNASAGNFSRDIEISWLDTNVRGGPPNTSPITVTVDCDISDEVASYDSTPAPGTTIDLGTTTNGVTTAAQTIDVTNDGVGSTTASDLTITGATTNDPQFAVTFDGSAISVGNTLADAIEVTCTPDAGTNGLITATLTVTHDGDDSPASPVEYPLECTGEPDGAFDSDPAPGGSLNLGIVPPATTTPEGTIDFFNNGDADEIRISCTFAGDTEIEFLSDPFDESIAPGGSVSAAFQCTPSAVQNFSGTLTCEVFGDQNFADPIDYTVSCQGQPLVVPTMNQWGLIIMSLMLLMVGGLLGRRWFANQA